MDFDVDVNAIKERINQKHKLKSTEDLENWG
jgi:hypothetical protein